MHIFERLGPGGGWSRSITALVLLLGVALVGCGGSQGARARTTARSPAGPAALAAGIDRAQTIIENPTAAPASVESAARSEQLAFAELAARRSLRRPTLARLSTAAARAAASNALRASDALARIVPVERKLPHWRVAAPPPPARLLAYFKQAAARYGLAWQYLAAIELVETRMGRIHGLSPAGARGPMQFMPATWAEYGHGSIESQRASIMAAARFLAANGGSRHIRLALFHYNPSRSYVTGVASYAREMRRNALDFYGYYYWQVLYRTTRGTFLLPAGYPRARPTRVSG